VEFPDSESRFSGSAREGYAASTVTQTWAGLIR